MKVIKTILTHPFFRYGAMIITASGIFILGGLILWVATLKIPHLDSFEERNVDQSTKIYARDGETLLFDVFEHTRRTVVSFDEVSDNIKYATLAIEDSDFYEHRGIQPRAILRAILVNLTEQDFAQGGSTLTQQVVKNSVLTSEKLISRKLKEWIFSIRLEQSLDKETIFEFYLNETPYGGSIYGVEQASRSFFGKSADEVTVAEAAYLAALPVAPTRLSPYGPNKNLLDARKNHVLNEMYTNGFITEEEYSEAREEDVRFLSREEGGIQAPHFVMYVQEYLEENYGRDVLSREGLRITTSLDHELQERAEEQALEYALQNVDDFNAENIALSAVDPRTGEILVMVGSRSYSDPAIDGNYNITTSKRQPGSAFKPFAYAQAFREGYTPETTLFDLRTQFSTACDPSNFSNDNPCYSPQNFDNSFRGPMTMREALAQSVNVPAVKTLYLAGLRDTARLAQNMGIQDLTDIDRYGLTMVLGGGEVSLLDMTSAYGVFANEGVRAPLKPVIKIENSDGEVIEEFETREDRVLERDIALTISDILSDNTARAPVFGPNSLLHFPNNDVAVKTGTTNEYKDAWAVGYTPDIVVGAWAGNNDNRSMERRVANFIITPFWRSFIEPLVVSGEYASSFPPAQEEDVSDLKPVLRGQWRGETGGVHSILHWVDKNNPRGSYPSNPSSDSQYNHWEYPVRLWVERQGIPTGTEEQINEESEGNDDSSNGGDINQPALSIYEPEEGGEYNRNEPLTVSFDHIKDTIDQTDIYINDSLILRNEGEQTSLTLDISDIPEGEVILKVEVTDSDRNSVTRELNIVIQ